MCYVQSGIPMETFYPITYDSQVWEVGEPLHTAFSDARSLVYFPKI